MATNAEAGNSPISNRISFWVLLAIIGIVGVMFYRVMASFFLPLFLAVLLVVIFQPVYDWLLVKCGNRRHVAGTLATLAVVVTVFVPAGFVLTIATSEAISMGKRFDTTKITGKLDELREKYGLELPFAEEIHAIDQTLEKLTELQLALPLATTAESNAAPDFADQDRPPPVPKPMPFSAAAAENMGRKLKAELGQLSGELASLPENERKAKEESLRKSLDAMIPTLESEGAFATSDRLDRTLAEVSLHWDEFKSTLLGGPLTARLKTLANPTADDVHQWKSQLFRELQIYLLPFTNAAAGFVVKLIFGSIIMVVSVFFFFVDGPTMIAAIMRLTPLDMRHQHELVEEFGNISRAVVVATLFSAIMQGMLAGLGFWVAGITSVAFLILITCVFAMVPFVGAVAVWVPVCLWLFVMEDQTKTAVLLAIYCGVIVSQADNVVKPLILQGKSKLHPLLALLSILGGVQALGPIGILIGPMVVVFLQTLLNILNRELSGEFKPAVEGAGAAASAVNPEPTPTPPPQQRHEKKKGKHR